MITSIRAVLSAFATLILGLLLAPTIQAQGRIVIQDRFATADGLKIHYLIAGKGEPVILLHGFAQTSRMWRPLMAELAKTRTVIAPDLRGFGQSSKPSGGYDKKTMAQDVHGLAASLGLKRESIVGHDIGLMV